MARKRMFSILVVDSDAFLDMPLSTQALYFHLNMRADDDGFLGNAKRIQKLIGSSEDDLKLLIAKRFLIPFEDGVLVIKHWRIHNTIKADRYTETIYKNEKKMLASEKGTAYSFKNDCKMETECLQNGNTGLGLGLGLGLEKELEIDKDKKEYGDFEKQKSPKLSDIDTFFESIWKMYPKKKGKGQVSKSQKKKLFDIGIDEMTRCLERVNKYYTDKKTEEQFMQQGSTFFNSGYLDYLDCNYADTEKKAEPIVIEREKTQEELEREKYHGYTIEELRSFNGGVL